MARTSGINTLVLIDHDGTLCRTNQLAYESIKYAVSEASKKLGIDPSRLDSDWDKIFCDTSGTTEKFMIAYICPKLSIGNTDIPIFEQYYYSARAKWYRVMGDIRNLFLTLIIRIWNQ